MRLSAGNLTTFTPDHMETDPKAHDQLLNCMQDERAVAGALMADHHLGYSMPIGGVIAYDGAVSPSGVGFDIACGNKAVQLDVQSEEINSFDLLKLIMRKVQKNVAFGVGRRNATPIDHPLFDSDLWPEIEALSPGLRDKAAAQLGTVGSGNHYVDILDDENGYVWIANHFGSRGFGHTIASLFLDEGDSETATVLDINTNRGALYFACMQLAGEYAYAGRDYVIDTVLDILGNPRVTQSVHNHHNFAWEEDGLIVVRKGATPLTHDPAFIGGSMGDYSMIVQGRSLSGTLNEHGKLTVEDLGNIGSAPHGAGRVMSRTKAAGKMKRVAIEKTRPDGTTYTKKVRMRDKSTALVDWDLTRQTLTERGIVVLGAGADEAPQVYKPLIDVIDAHENIEILHMLKPLGVVMAGPDEFDPYKD